MTISALTKNGIGKESAWGSFPGGVNRIPVEPPTLTTTYEQILDNALRGEASTDFHAWQGIGRSEITLAGLGYTELIGHFLLAIMGGVATTQPDPTGAPSLYKHVFSLDDAPPSYSIVEYPRLRVPGGTEENYAYQFLGALCREFVIRFNAGEGAIGFTSSWNAKPEERVTPPTIWTVSEGDPFLGWEGKVTIGGASYARLVLAEWTLTREVVLQAAASATKAPSFGYTGTLGVRITATVEFHSDDDIAYYRNNTQPSFEVTFERGTPLTNDYKLLKITCPRVSFLEGAPERDRGAVDFKLNWTLRALYDASVGGPIQFELQNNVSGY